MRLGVRKGWVMPILDLKKAYGFVIRTMEAIKTA